MIISVFVLLYILSVNIKYLIFFLNCFYFFVLQVSFRVRVRNLITRNHWIVNNTCQIFTIFATAYSRISNMIFFTYMMFPALTWTFIVISPYVWIRFSSIKFTFTLSWYNALLMFWIHLFPWSYWTRLDLKILFYLENLLY